MRSPAHNRHKDVIVLIALAAVAIAFTVFIIFSDKNDRQNSIISHEDAILFGKRALTEYAGHVCPGNISSILFKDSAVERYIDSEEHYHIIFLVSTKDGREIDAAVDVPIANFNNETNSADVGGGVILCNRSNQVG